MIKELKKIICIMLVGSMLFIMGACRSNSKDNITVASKPWTEQLIFGYLLYNYLDDKGYEVDEKIGLGETQTLRPAMESDQIDLYYEYTGTILMAVMKSKVITNSKECYEVVKKWDNENNGIKWLNYSNANNTFVLMVTKDFSEKNNIKSISDLKSYINKGNQATLGCSIDFIEREDGIKGLQKIYDFTYNEDDIVSMEVGLTYNALENGQLDVAMGFGTDGRIIAKGFVVLEDDMSYFPVYNPTPIIREEILNKYPNLEKELNLLTEKLTTETVQMLNQKVDVDGMDPEKVAIEFLKENNLID